MLLNKFGGALLEKVKTMRKVLLGAVLSVAFGLSANGAGATGPVGHSAKRLACHWVTTGDHTLRLLRHTFEPVSKTAIAPADRPVRHVSTAAPASKSSSRAAAVKARPLVRAELAHIERQVVQRISLIVGVSY
jgi:hypothetical protein